MIGLLRTTDDRTRINSVSVYGSSFLAGLVSDEAALKVRKSHFESGRDVRGKYRKGIETTRALIVCLLLAMLCDVSRADEPVYEIDIPAMNAAEALNRFAEQTGAIMLFPYDLASARQANDVSGRYTLLEGLGLLLQDTGLSGGLSDERVVKISLRGNEQRNEKQGSDMGREQKRGILAGVASVAVAVFGAQSATGQGIPERRAIEEIVVTATKRETTLLETPLAVSVISGEIIEKRNLVGMEDFLAGIPGVSYQDRGAAANSITIRGIGLGSQLDPNSPVGSYFGEVPVTGLGTPANGLQAGNADIKMVDINRVEVLRGPQGTLYGSGSMGGTVRLIPNLPDLQDAEGRVAAEFSDTDRSGGNNYMVQAAASTPLIEDKLALRMVAYRVDNEGYIDNVAGSQPNQAIQDAVAIGVFARDRRHVGGDDTNGFRGILLWKPVDNLTVTSMHAYQKVSQDGFEFVQTDLPGKYLQSRAQVGFAGEDYEYATQEINLTNLVVEYDAGWGSFLNSTSKILQKGTSDIEFSLFGPPFLGISAPNKNRRDIYVNEFRFVSDFDGPLQVIAGLYYEDREVDADSTTTWNGARPEPADTYFELLDNVNTQEQFAAFGELAFTPFDPLTLTLGARYFDFEQAIVRSRNLDIPDSQEGRRAGVDGINWKVSLAYKFTPELFTYAIWSQGFREPQFQGIILPEFDADNNGLVEFRDGIEREVTEGLLDPDSIDNYEIGIKYQSDDRRFQVALTGFLIDWTGIPVVPALTAYLGQALYFNAGQARSTGVELEVSVEPVENLILQLAASYINAELSEEAPGLGPKGADLPGSADWNVHASLDKRFTLASHEAFVRGDYTYVSEYFNSLAEAGTPSGNYHLFDLSAGVTIDRFRLGVFVKNLTNRSDFTWIDNAFGFDLAYRLRPRTIGINLAANF